MRESPDEAAVRDKARAILERRIDALPAALRTVFVLRALEGLSVEDTAAALGISEATVRASGVRARQLLRKALSSNLRTAVQDAFCLDAERCDGIVRSVLSRITQRPGA
jgi:RNA polymerase sigma-70 factor (ECF subfamily)